jgi:hypothetical protein
VGRLRQGRSWVFVVVVGLTVALAVWFLLAIPGCGSGSSGIG